MKFQYIACGDEPPERTEFMGHSFTLNHKGVEVTNEIAIRKLLGNPSFRVMEDSDPKKKKSDT